MNAPQRIGPFRIVSKLGEGGMGVVYLAVQDEPVARQVAIKLLKPGPLGAGARARFDTERRTLALMSHPNVARVIQAGADHDQPYVVMEYVPGPSLTDYCTLRQLDLPARLRLFVAVCHGVQHAHQRGVIHRDLKPSNILVMEEYGEAVPKVIDFGIAKLTADGNTAERTRAGEAIGTPDYMSPEQLTGTAAEVDTRSDVYALGAVLYELLTGTTPHELRERGLDQWQARDLLRHAEPPAPSVRLNSRGGGATAAPLAEELDWIALKAIARWQEDRYLSPADLAADVERYLQGEPIAAGPRTGTYLLRKFLRRHALASSLTALLVVSLFATTAHAVWQARQLRIERDLAAEASARAGTVTAFLVDLFAVADPQSGFGEAATVRQALDVGVQRLRHELAAEPEVRAALHRAAGLVYQSLGEYASAERELRDALALRRTLAGADSADVARATRDLARLLGTRGDFAAAIATLEAALATPGAAAAAHPTEAAALRSDIGEFSWKSGDVARAEAEYAAAAALLEAAGATASTAYVDTRYGIATVHVERGRYAEAEQPLREALHEYERLFGPEHQRTYEARNQLIHLLLMQERYPEAERMALQTAASFVEIYGEQHPQAAMIYNNVAVALFEQGRHAEAEQYFLRTLALQRKLKGERHFEVTITLNTLAFVYAETGRADQAVRTMEEVYAIRRETLGAVQNDTLIALHNLGGIYAQHGRRPQAVEALERAIAGFVQLEGADSWHAANSERSLGELLTQLRRYPEAERRLLHAHGILQARLGAAHGRTQRTRRNLAELYRAWGRPDAAARYDDAAPQPSP